MTGEMTNVQTLLGLRTPPVAIGFLSQPPDGVPAWKEGTVPAGCVFWKKAQEGQTFYTVPADHYHCAVGAYTHHIPLPEARAPELEQTIGFMVDSGYIAMAEVPGIPTLRTTPACIAYSPVGRAPFVPDVVVVSAQPAQAMLLYEAALKAGVSPMQMGAIGRPGCAILPLTQQTGTAALSLGCKGNRTFTGLPTSEMYLSIPGEKWGAVVEQLVPLVQANQRLENHYVQHKAQFQTA